MKTASIFKRLGNGYVIFGSGKTKSGFRIALGPFINISESQVSNEIIVNSIRASLCNDDSKRVPDPQSWPEFNNSFLQKVGLKKSKELDSPKSRLVYCQEENEKITFVPSYPAEKPDKGFLFSEDVVVIEKNASDVEIYSAYEEALSRCK